MPIPKIVADDIVQVIIESEVLNQTCLNVLYYKAKVGQPTKTYFEALDELMVKVGAPADPTVVRYMTLAMAGNTRVKNIRSQRVSPNRDIYIQQAVDGPGQLAPTCTLSNVTATLTKQVEIAGRGRQGSFHLAGLISGGYTAGSLTVAQVLLMQNLAAKIQANILAPDASILWEPGTFSPQGGAGGFFHQLTNVFPQTTVRTMRRRTVGLGI